MKTASHLRESGGNNGAIEILHEEGSRNESGDVQRRAGFLHRSSLRKNETILDKWLSDTMHELRRLGRPLDLYVRESLDERGNSRVIELPLFVAHQRQQHLLDQRSERKKDLVRFRGKERIP